MPISQAEVGYLQSLSDEDKTDLLGRLNTRLEEEGYGTKTLTGPKPSDYTSGKKEPSAWTRFKYGAEEMGWSVGKAVALGKRSDPLRDAQDAIQQEKWRRIEAGAPVHEVHSWEIAEMQNAQNSIKVQAMTELMRQQQLQQKEEYLSSKYEGIYGTPYAQSAAANVGRIGALLADPINFIPVVGQESLIARGMGWISKEGLEKIGVLAAQGGAITAMDQAISDMYATGEIDPENMAIAGGLGALLLPVAVMGGDKFFSWLKAKKAAGTKVTSEEVGQQLETYGMDLEQLDVSALADELNTSVLAENPAASFDKMAEEVSNASQLAEMQAKEAPTKVLAPEVETDVTRVATAYQENAKTLEALDATADPAARAGLLDQLADKANPEILPEPPALVKPRYDVGQHPDNLARREATRAKEFDASVELTRQAGLDASTSEDLPWFLKKQAGVGPTEGGPAGTPMFFKKQAGGISAQMATQLGTTFTGAAMGYAWDGEEGAVMGAMIGMGLPWASRKAYPALKSLLDAPGKVDDYLIRSTWGSAFARPWKRIEMTGGSAGKAIARNLDEAQKLVRERSGKLFYPLQKAFKGKDEAFQTNVMEVLQGRSKPLNAEAGQVASKIRKMFHDDIDEAVKLGLLKQENAAKYKTNDYFPRIYNEVFLSTDKGKELWIKQLTGVKFKPGDASIVQALEHILHGKGGEISDFIKLQKPFEKQGEYLVLTRAAAMRLLEKRRVADPRSRSRHLEKSRIFPKEWDAVLQPFLVKNPLAALANYIDDTSKRLQFAKVFGANDEGFERLASQMENDASVPHADYARQEYYKEVGQADKSEIITSQIGQSELQRRMWGGLNALATLKMTMSAILDLTQLPVMATAYLSKNMNPLRVAQVFTKGVFSTLDNQGELGKDAAELAAAAIDTTLMQYMSEGKLGNTLGGLLPGRLGESLRDPSYFKGILSPLNILNSPVTFLKAFGHLPAEHLNRLVAGSMGRANFEYLMGIKAKLEKGEIKFRTKAAEEKVRKGLEEMRIDPDKKSWEYDKDDYVRAANAFSDIVNFRNESDMPHWMQDNPFWAIATKFKSYGFKQGAFIKDHILPPAKEFILSGGTKGSLMPLMSYFGMGTTMGMAADEFKRWILSDDRELTLTERVLRAQMQFGGIGLMLDATVRFGSKYTGDAVSFVFGPIGSILWDTAAVEFPRFVDRAKEHGIVSEEALASLAHTVIKEPTGNFPGKKQMLDDLKEIYGRKKRKRERGKAKKSRARTTGSY